MGRFFLYPVNDAIIDNESYVDNEFYMDNECYMDNKSCMDNKFYMDNKSYIDNEPCMDQGHDKSPEHGLALRPSYEALTPSEPAARPGHPAPSSSGPAPRPSHPHEPAARSYESKPRPGDPVPSSGHLEPRHGRPAPRLSADQKLPQSGSRGLTRSEARLERWMAEAGWKEKLRVLTNMRNEDRSKMIADWNKRADKGLEVDRTRKEKRNERLVFDKKGQPYFVRR